MASSTRVTPWLLNSPVSIGVSHDAGTNDIAARLYTSSGRTSSMSRDQGELIEQVAGPQLDAVEQVLDAPEIRRRGTSHHADHAVTLVEEELGKIRAVLPSDAGNQCSFLHAIRMRWRHAPSTSNSG